MQERLLVPRLLAGVQEGSAGPYCYGDALLQPKSLLNFARVEASVQFPLCRIKILLLLSFPHTWAMAEVLYSALQGVQNDCDANSCCSGMKRALFMVACHFPSK